MTIFLTLLFSLVGQGAGQAYMADMKKAYVYGGVYAVMPIFAAMILFLVTKGSTDRAIQVASVFLAVTAAVALISILDALFTAIKLRNTPHVYHWKKALLFAIGVQAAHVLLRAAVVPLLIRK